MWGYPPTQETLGEWILHTTYKPNMSVRRGSFFWGISVHKGEVLFISSVYIKKGYEENWGKRRCTKGALRFKENLTIDVLVSSNLNINPLLSYGNSLQWLPCPILLGCVCGFKGFISMRLLERSWAPLSFLSRLWRSYFAFIYVYLMQSLINTS